MKKNEKIKELFTEVLRKYREAQMGIISITGGTPHESAAKKELRREIGRWKSRLRELLEDESYLDGLQKLPRDIDIPIKDKEVD